MKKEFLNLAVATMVFGTAVSASAEEAEKAVSLDLGADVVSSYIWRGQECGGFSIQPEATVTFNKPGISLGAWASVELFAKDPAVHMTEFDLLLSWSPIEPLSIGVTDYYFGVGNYLKDWRWNGTASHNLELNLAYDFGPVALAWNTVLTGADYHYNDKGEETRNYSTYVEVSAPWTLAGVEGSAAIGASLWDDAFSAIGNTKFNVCNIALTAKKEVFRLPLMGQVVFNPQSDKVYFVIGLTF